MAELLNFNPNRALEFEPGRPIGFDPQRPLEFDLDRDLDFSPGRDLGFGRRGVVFRGYVCPICGALVTEDAKRCNECGARFDDNPRTGKPPAGTGAAPPARKEEPRKAAPPGPKAVAPAGETFCAFCGVKLKRADAFCWNCGARSTGSGEAVKLPAKKGPPVTREWRQVK